VRVHARGTAPDALNARNVALHYRAVGSTLLLNAVTRVTSVSRRSTSENQMLMTSARAAGLR